MANIPRSEALKVLNQEGMLLIMCSLVDNMPYVLTEAAVSHTANVYMHVPADTVGLHSYRPLNFGNRHSDSLMKQWDVTSTPAWTLADI